MDTKQSQLTFSVSKAAAIIGILSLASRMVGLLRDRLFASTFGAGDTLDVYYAAFRIPDFIFNLLVLGTLSVAFIPIFTEWFIKDKNRALEIANTIFNMSVLAMGAICLTLFAFSPQLTKFLVPGFGLEKFQQTLLLTRILLISPIIFTASNVLGSILNARKKFFLTGLAPILYNLGIIFGLLFLYPKIGLSGLGYGVIIGAGLHFLVQAAGTFKLGLAWSPVINITDSGVKKIWGLFLPRVFGVDPSQISLLAGSVIGSMLGPGTIAVLNLANNLQAVPVGIFAISISVAAFPLLSELYANNDHENFISTLSSSITKILFFILPSTIFILLFRAYIVRLIYGAGHFNWENTLATFNTLGIFSISLFSQSLIPLLSRAFYARQNTKIPVISGLVSLGLNIALAYWFSSNPVNISFQLGNFGFNLAAEGAGAIALGYVLSSVVNCALLFILLRNKLLKKVKNHFLISNFDRELSINAAKILAASILAGFTGYACLFLFAPLVKTDTFLGILIQSGFSAILASVAYFVSVRKLGLQQAIRLTGYFKTLKGRFGLFS